MLWSTASSSLKCKVVLAGKQRDGQNFLVLVLTLKCVINADSDEARLMNTLRFEPKFAHCFWVTSIMRYIETWRHISLIHHMMDGSLLQCTNLNPTTKTVAFHRHGGKPYVMLLLSWPCELLLLRLTEYLLVISWFSMEYGRIFHENSFYLVYNEPSINILSYK
jgi:hypothetical protein